VAARRPSQPQGGRCRWNAGTFTFTGIQSGPPVYPLHGPVRARQPLPPRGRCARNRGTYAQAGPRVTPLRGPVTARRPGPYRNGQCTATFIYRPPPPPPPFTIGQLTTRDVTLVALTALTAAIEPAS
jgi:hypothetical protein